MVFPGDDTATWMRYVAKADTCGFHGLGIGDSPSIYPDVYMHGALAATATRNVRIGPLVTNPLVRHPLAAACNAATLERLAPGRSFLAIGSGNSAADNAGVKPASVEYLETYVKAVKDLLARGSATWQGAKVQFAMQEPRVPVYVAASGPNMLRMGGRAGDGVIVGCGIGREGVDFALSHIEAGAAEAGRSLADVDVWFLVYASVAETDEAAFSAIGNSIATKVRSTYKNEKAIQSLPASLQASAREVSSNYNALHHSDFGFSGHARLVDRHPALVEYIAERNFITGSPETVVKRLNATHATGVRGLWMSIRVADKMKVLDLWARSVANRGVLA